MTTIYEIPTKKLFVAACIIKILSSLITLTAPGTGYLFWTFGLIVPMLAMAIYVYVGINRKDRTLTDDKFADSCYYLGFLFTIAAIVISLIDIGSAKVSIEALAWRFGVAMVSTVIGMAVRVYLVNFRVEADDAVRIVEDALISGAERFTNNLELASERYRRFEADINTSTNQVLEHINQRLEKMIADYAVRLAEQFNDVSLKIERISTAALEQINKASSSVLDASTHVQEGIRSTMDSFQEDMKNYQVAIKRNLEESVLPHDFFASKISPAVEGLSEAVAKQSSLLMTSYDSVSKVAMEMTDSLAAMNRRAVAAGKAIESLEHFAFESKQLSEAVKDLSSQMIKTLEMLDTTIRSSPTQQSQANAVHLLGQTILNATNQIDTQLQALPQILNYSKSALPSNELFIEQMTNISNQLKAGQGELRQLIEPANKLLFDSVHQLSRSIGQLETVIAQQAQK